MTTTVDIMQSSLYKSLKKMGVSHNTAIQAWIHTRDKSLKSKTLSARPLDIDAYTNIGFTGDEAIEMQKALVAAKGTTSDVNFIQIKTCIK